MYNRNRTTGRPDELGMILVMGVTGSGKSHFINKLVEGSVTEDGSLYSCMVRRALHLSVKIAKVLQVPEIARSSRQRSAKSVLLRSLTLLASMIPIDLMQRY